MRRVEEEQTFLVGFEGNNYNKTLVDFQVFLNLRGGTRRERRKVC